MQRHASRTGKEVKRGKRESSYSDRERSRVIRFRADKRQSDGKRSSASNCSMRRCWQHVRLHGWPGDMLVESSVRLRLQLMTVCSQQAAQGRTPRNEGSLSPQTVANRFRVKALWFRVAYVPCRNEARCRTISTPSRNLFAARRRNELENNLPPKAKMDLQKEMLQLCDANNGWTRDLLGRDRERLKHELERAGPDVALTLPLLTTLHEAHEAMQAYRRHLLDTIERIKRGAL